MDVRQIQSFLALYKTRNVTRAALELGLVQPAVSTQIAKLETELGVRLFERSTRGVTPTAEGETLHGLVLPLARELESVRQGMLDLGGRPTGVVRLGAVPSLSVGVVPHCLAGFCNSHPDVTVQLSEGYSATLLQQVESGNLDLALINDLQQPNGLVVEPLASEELVIVTAAGSGVLGSSGVSLAELTRTNVIVPSRGQGLRVLLDRTLAQAGLVLKPRLEFDALTPTLELVRRGDWAAVLPLIAVARELEAGEFSIHRLAEPIERSLVIVHHPRRPLSLAARLLAGLLGEEARQVVARAGKRAVRQAEKKGVSRRGRTPSGTPAASSARRS